MYHPVFYMADLGKAKLYTMPAASPKNLQHRMAHCDSLGIGLVVSLLPEEEMGRLGLLHEGQICEANNLSFCSFPINDFGVPTSKPLFTELLESLVQKLDQGISIVVHCRGGIGRSGLLVGALLIRYGYRLDDALEQMARSRGTEMPETEEQLAWLEDIQLSLQGKV